MAHQDAGHYAAKHPEGTKADPRIAEKIEQQLVGNRILCTSAHEIAQDLSVTPDQVGQNLDLLEVRISKCQMGLFGYSPEKRIVKPASNISTDLNQAIENSLVEGRISCERCWEIARQQGIRRIDVASACEAKRIKIIQCQLGAF